MKISKISELGKLADYLSPNEATIEVDQGGWSYGDSELATLGVATCIVLAAHNAPAHRGLLGHFSSVSPEAQSNPQLANELFDADKFQEAVDALHSLGSPEFTYAWIGGAALHTQNTVMADRAHAEHALQSAAEKYGIADSAIMIDWNTSEHDLYVHLNCSTGVLIVQPMSE